MAPRAPGNLSPSSLSPDIPLLVQDIGRDPSGQTLAINPDKGSQKFFWLRALGNNNTFTTSLSANGQAVINLTAPPEENLRGDYDVCYLHAKSTGRFSVQMFQTTINRNFQNTAIPDNIIFGTASFPGYLPETIYTPTTTGLQLTITDLSGAANTVEIVGVGRRFLDWGNERIGDARRRAFYGRRTHPFWLMDNRGGQRSVAGSGTDTLVMNVPPDADFNCTAILDDSDFDYTMQIFEGLSSRALMDAQISCQSYVAANTTVFGMGGPVVTPSSMAQGWGGGRLASGGGSGTGWSHLFKRSSQINISVTNLSATANNVRLALVGQLVYYSAPVDERLTLPENYAAREQGLMRPAPLQGYGAQTGPFLPMGTVPGNQPGPVNPGMSGGSSAGMGYIPMSDFTGRR